MYVYTLFSLVVLVQGTILYEVKNTFTNVMTVAVFLIRKRVFNSF